EPEDQEVQDEQPRHDECHDEERGAEVAALELRPRTRVERVDQVGRAPEVENPDGRHRPGSPLRQSDARDDGENGGREIAPRGRHREGRRKRGRRDAGHEGGGADEAAHMGGHQPGERAVPLQGAQPRPGEEPRGEAESDQVHQDADPEDRPAHPRRPPAAVRAVYSRRGDSAGASFGRANPAAMSQTKPGKRVSGMRKRSAGNTRENQLNSPMTPSRGPSPAIQRGSSFASPAETDPPAIRMPRGTEYPTPPTAYTT